MEICGRATFTIDTSSCDTTKARLEVPTTKAKDSAFLATALLTGFSMSAKISLIAHGCNDFQAGFMVGM
jgi:hypothetical protein